MERDLLFWGEQEEKDVLMPHFPLLQPASEKPACLHFSSGEMCEEKTQAVITCNSSVAKNNGEREESAICCVWLGSQEGMNSLLP